MKGLKNSLEKIKEEGRDIQKEIRDRTVSYVIAGLSLVVGLAWNDAIRALIEVVFPIGQETLLARFIYAATITVVLVVLTMYLLRTPSKKKGRSA